MLITKNVDIIDKLNIRFLYTIGMLEQRWQMKDGIEISLPIRDQVADILRRRIISGELRPGEKISERELSAALNVSTAPIKDAIRTLNVEGLLRTYPRRGTFVTNVLGENIFQLIHTRSVIEGSAAYWGTINITDEGLSQMESYLQKFERLLHTADMTDPEVLDQVTGYNYHFHLILSNAAGNDYLNRLIQIMGSINNTIRHIYYFSDFSTDYEQSLTDHTDIYNAAKSRDPELAEKLTVTHIRRVGEVVLEKNGITPDE